MVRACLRLNLLRIVLDIFVYTCAADETSESPLPPGPEVDMKESWFCDFSVDDPNSNGVYHFPCGFGQPADTSWMWYLGSRNSSGDVDLNGAYVFMYTYMHAAALSA